MAENRRRSVLKVGRDDHLPQQVVATNKLDLGVQILLRNCSRVLRGAFALAVTIMSVRWRRTRNFICASYLRIQSPEKHQHQGRRMFQK